MVMLLPCDLEVSGSNSGDSLSAFSDKAAYVYSLQNPLDGSLVHFVAFILILVALFAETCRYAGR